jgi:hypothetical protein
MPVDPKKFAIGLAAGTAILFWIRTHPAGTVGPADRALSAQEIVKRAQEEHGSDVDAPDIMIAPPPPPPPLSRSKTQTDTR